MYCNTVNSKSKLAATNQCASNLHNFILWAFDQFIFNTTGFIRPKRLHEGKK